MIKGEKIKKALDKFRGRTIEPGEVSPTAEDYLSKHFGEVEGFLDIVDARLFLLFNTLQKDGGIEGDLFEIGVHHGKSAVLLALLADPSKEILHVNDLFEKQEQNVSRSGLGSRDLFLRNMARLVGETPYLRIHKGLSQDLNPKDFDKNVRMFHIDGGHSAEETYSDLLFASRVTSGKGVIIVDDYFNRSWPGVSEGATRFMLEHRSVTPVMIGNNKVFFVKNEALPFYREGLDSEASRTFLSLQGLRFRDREWMGNRVLLIDGGAIFKCQIETKKRRYVLNRNEVSNLPLTVKNLSGITLHSTPGIPVFVSYHLLDRQGNMIVFDNSRTPIEIPIPRGMSGPVSLTVDKIDERGNYLIEIDCVYEGVTWFKESGGRTLQVEIEVV